MLRRLAACALLALLVSCTAAVPGAPGHPSSRRAPGTAKTFTPPRWTTPSPGPVLLGDGVQEAGWDGGYLLAGPNTPDIDPAFYSPDGKTWIPERPDPAIRSAARAGDRGVAGYGTAAYLLAEKAGVLTVSRTVNGRQWDEIPIRWGGLQGDLPSDIGASVVAGPHGVLVVAYDVTLGFDGYYTAFSRDGRSFSPLTHVPAVFAGGSPALQATGEGFLLGSSDGARGVVITSPDGVHWRSAAPRLTGTNGVGLIAANTSTIVVFPYQTGVPVGKSLAWYERDGVWRPARVDFGRLPDAGVVPADQIRVNVARSWGSGFLAIGNTFGGEGAEVSGLVWYSADGSSWTRMPTHAHHFDAARELQDVAVSGRTAVMLGYPAGDTGDRTLTWRAASPRPTGPR